MPCWTRGGAVRAPAGWRPAAAASNRPEAACLALRHLAVQRLAEGRHFLVRLHVRAAGHRRIGSRGNLDRQCEVLHKELVQSAFRVGAAGRMVIHHLLVALVVDLALLNGDVCIARYEAFGTAGNASKIKPISLEAMYQRYLKGELNAKVN